MLLRNKDKDSLIAIFSTLNLPVEVWAYGSRVTGGAHEGSDLDLVIRGNQLQPLPLQDYIALKEKIRESNIPILVELLDWGRLPKNFHQQIEKHYELLFTNLSPSSN